MTPVPAPISTLHRLARFARWAWLWLLKHAWALMQDGPQAKRSLDAATRGVASLILLRAAELGQTRMPSFPPAPPRRRLQAQRRECRGRFWRAALGAQIYRQVFVRADKATRIAALFSALRDWQRLAARVAKRWPRRFSRLASSSVCRRLPGVGASLPAGSLRRVRAAMAMQRLDSS